MAVLETHKLHGGYARRDSILSEVDLRLAPGEIHGIVRPNGSGKTTLLRHLARLMTPHQGRVLIDGEDLANLSRRDVARRLALASTPVPGTWPLSVRYAVQLGRAAHRGWLMPWTDQDAQAVEL